MSDRAMGTLMIQSFETVSHEGAGPLRHIRANCGDRVVSFDAVDPAFATDDYGTITLELPNGTRAHYAIVSRPVWTGCN